MTKIYALLLAFSLLFSGALSAQVFPYFEAFDAYTPSQPLNGVGGFRATNDVYVTAHGVIGNCAEFQMSPLATHDTLISPYIGPLTAHTITSFYYRVVTFSGSTPVLYIMTAGDTAKIIVGDSAFIFPIPQYTINSGNQNTTSGYVKVIVPVTPLLANNSGKFKILAINTSGHTWNLEFDSLVVMDTVVIRPVITTVSITNTNCRGDSSGGIHVSVSGASPPYRFLWSSGDTTAIISGKPAGIYTLTVTDSIGATSSVSDTIGQPQFTLLLDSLTHINVICRGESTGSAAIYASGGTPSYSYQWSTSPVQATPSAQNLSAGTYTVTVSDSHHCTVTATTQITQPATGLTATVSSTGSTGTNGTATITATEGAGTLSYLWSPSGQTTSTATALAPGAYTVTVTDSLGCTLSGSVTVSNLSGISEIDNNALIIYPNPVSDQLHISIEGKVQTQMTILISDMSGRVVLTNNTTSGTINVSSLANGVYVIKVNSEDKVYLKHITIQR
jgi:hypothetical protein